MSARSQYAIRAMSVLFLAAVIAAQFSGVTIADMRPDVLRFVWELVG